MMDSEPTRKQADGRPTPSRRGVTRRDILDVALKLFAENGFRKTSLELVANRLGVTRQALYYHFRSKEAILMALFDEMMSKLESAVANVKAPDEEPVFLSLLRAHIEAAIDNPELVALLLHERPEIGQLKDLQANQRRREYAVSFVESYKQGQAENLFDASIDPWVAVNTVLAAANAISWWYRGERGAASKDVVADVFELLTVGFLRPAEQSTLGLPGMPTNEAAAA
jgi:AcrR family transcriptional regulator